jgi:hypothetical protein
MHRFCKGCIVEWCKQSNQCPVCRTVAQRLLFNVQSDSQYEQLPVERPRPSIHGSNMFDFGNDQEIEAFHRMLMQQLRMLPSIQGGQTLQGNGTVSGVTITLGRQVRGPDGRLVHQNQVVFIPESDTDPRRIRFPSPNQGHQLLFPNQRHPMPMFMAPRNAATMDTFRRPRRQSGQEQGHPQPTAATQSGSVLEQQFTQLANTVRAFFGESDSQSTPNPKADGSSRSNRNPRHPDKPPR